MISLCITHRVDEDISWVEDLYADLLIFNKNKTWDLPYECVSAPKISNETDTFLRGIILSYDKLHRYKNVFLLKPNCQDYQENLISDLSIKQYNQVREDKIVFLSENILLFNYVQMVENVKSLSENIENNLKILNYIDEMMSNLGVSLSNESYPIAVGSQYRVPTVYILNKSKKWWILLQSYYFGLYELVGDHVSQIFEFLWPKILLHSDM